MLTAAGGYLAERAADLSDIADRAVALLLGEPMPGIPSPGHPFVLLANIGGPGDVPAVIAAEAEGIGLLRTEFLFLDRHDEPSAEEQRATYAEILARVRGRRVVVRTLDAGADKPLAFASQEAEPNPALGLRGLRLDGLLPALLDTQLEALALAAKGTGADVWVMAPMVSVPAEAAAFADLAHGHGLPVAGVMIEVPAAALRAAQIIEQVDFVSVGTNDLSQYTFAADRQAGALAPLLDPWQPALLQLIAMTAAAGRAAGKPVSICGEAASDPLLAIVAAGLGVTSLSMAPPALADVRAALATRTLAQCEAAARDAARAAPGG
jgi:phosphotransferase system enzyme I (PtsI)